MHNAFIKELIEIRKEKKAREREGLCLIEGKKTIHDIAKILPLVHLISTNPLDLPAKETFEVPQHVIDKISGCVSPEGVVATVALPRPSSLKGKNWVLGFDRIQDPGNLGTLIRTALAFGWEGIFLTEGCCDLFHEKVLRATKGASLLIPYQTGHASDLLQLDLPLFCGDLGGETPLAVEKALLILGNEGAGVAPIFQAKCRPLTIPMKSQMESLNVSVAGALLMAKLKGVL